MNFWNCLLHVFSIEPLLDTEHEWNPLGDAFYETIPPPLSLNASQVELAQQVAVACHCALSLVHLNQYPGLVVRVRREHLRLIHRHRRIALDERRHHAAGRLQFKAQSCHIQQQGRVELVRLLLAR